MAYKEFDIYPIFSNECLKRSPNISGLEVKEIFEGVKKRFLKQESEHEYFLFFVVSKIIEMKKIGISRCSYIIEITRGNKPKISGFFRRANQFAKYEMAKEQMKF